MGPKHSSELLAEIAAELKISLYQRHTEDEVCHILGVSVGELRQIRQEGRIGCVMITKSKREHFGFQIIDFLLDSMLDGDMKAEAGLPVHRVLDEPPAASGPAPMLISIDEAMNVIGIGRTKLYELIGEGRIEIVKLGRRTLVRTESLRRLASDPAT